LTGLENATVLFPVVSAGTIIASVLAGKVIFKEKNNFLKYMAILFGILAVILLKL
jgi:multidrug transporter EmrE-like cation transporter